MKFILSPAKKMISDPDSLPYRDLPSLIEKTRILKDILQRKSYGRLKRLWRCNDRIADYNFGLLQNMNLYNNLTPALLSYDGIRFKYMAPSVFSRDEFSYLQDRLFILSGFYGRLRPFDGVVQYRLEMGSGLCADTFKNLYDFWKDDIYKTIGRPGDVILNLASAEYSRCVEKYAYEKNRFITCVFRDMIDGRLIEKGTKCKMARGEMVRFAAENRIDRPEDLQYFDRQNYVFKPKFSDEKTYVFVQENTMKKLF